MRELTWDEYYENFYNWSTSTQMSYLSRLNSYGSPDEITEIAMEFGDEKAADRLVRRAIEAGVQFSLANFEDLSICVSAEMFKCLLESRQESYTHDIFKEMLEHVNYDEVGSLIEKSIDKGMRFSPDQVMEWLNIVDSPVLVKMALTVTGKFTKAQAEELFYALPENEYRIVAEKLNLDMYRLQGHGGTAYRQAKPKLGFFGTLFAVMAGQDILSGFEKKHHDACTGDCAHCPPHYGYRYGRWYYGHGHDYGCEFGGNKGGRG